MVSIVYAEAPPLSVEVFAGSPWVGVTVRGLAAGDHVVTVWRTADGERLAVRGGRRRRVVDSDYLIDYEVPLERPVTYEVEVLLGPDAGRLFAPVTVFVESDCGYIHDPADPTTVVPVYGDRSPNGEPTFRGQAFASLLYEADVSVHTIIGSSKPVAIGGLVQAVSGVDLSMLTRAEAENTRLRDMLAQTSTLVVRGLPGWVRDAWPGLAYVSKSSHAEQPLDVPWGGYLTRWQLQGRIVRGTNSAVLISLFTYQDVAALYATYEQKQTAMGGRTYLDDLKNPLGT